MAVSPEALEQAWTSLPTNLRDALDLAHRRITDFHQRQRPSDLAVTGPHGEQLGRRWRPVQRAGLYVPGGRALNLLFINNKRLHSSKKFV